MLQIRRRAAQLARTIVLPESSERCVLPAALEILRANLTEAACIIDQRSPDLNAGGQAQPGGVIMPQRFARKICRSSAGRSANVLVFTDCSAVHLVCRLAERLCRARPTGPIVQSLVRQVNYLSCDCRYEGIIDVVAITAVQASWPARKAGRQS